MSISSHLSVHATVTCDICDTSNILVDDEIYSGLVDSADIAQDELRRRDDWHKDDSGVIRCDDCYNSPRGCDGLVRLTPGAHRVPLCRSVAELLRSSPRTGKTYEVSHYTADTIITRLGTRNDDYWRKTVCTVDHEARIVRLHPDAHLDAFAQAACDEFGLKRKKSRSIAHFAR